jgi:spore germination protein KA
MWLNFIARKLRFAKNAGYHPQDGAPDAKENGADCIEKKLARNIQNIKDTFGGTADLKIHFFNIGRIKKISGALVYIDGLVDSKLITDAVLYPLTNWADAGRPAGGKDLIGHIAESAICSGDVKTLVSLPDAVRECLSGCVLVYAEGCAAVLSASVKGWEKRGVTEPQSETVVRGPREGFTENLRTNTALIRRKIKSASLRMLNLSAGRKTATDICLVYLDGVADPKVIDTVRYRIENLDVDSILDSGYIEEYIEDAPFSPFATVNYTEKPDVAAARILEGRVGIIVDGTPFVLTAPICFSSKAFRRRRIITPSALRQLYALAAFHRVFHHGFLRPPFISPLRRSIRRSYPTTLLFTIANAARRHAFSGLYRNVHHDFCF